jgi:hypothetical protein
LEERKKQQPESREGGLKPALSGKKVFRNSENQLQSKLNLPRRAKVPGREPRARDFAESCARRTEGESRIPEVRMIKDVEHFSTELQIQLLRQFRVLDDRKVRVDKTRPGD